MKTITLLLTEDELAELTLALDDRASRINGDIEDCRYDLRPGVDATPEWRDFRKQEMARHEESLTAVRALERKLEEDVA